MSPEECGPKIMEALTKAIELDSTNADVIYTQACMNTWMLWDWEAGESAFKKTLEINPNHAEAHAYYSHLLNIIGKPEDAMKEIEIALELDPFNPLLISLYSVDLIFVRRFEEAIKAAKEALRMEPTAPVALSGLEWALHITGRYEEAWEVVKKDYEGVGLGRYFNQDINESGYADALNKAAEAIKILADSTFINPSFLANLYILAGNKEPALECLEKAYEIREPNLPYLRSPLFDIIREEPRFQEIVRKMNLPYK
jgi:tetratricopeptide (TPR) repeat protein